MRVLVVEDDPSIRVLVTELLSDEGYAFALATTHAEALALATAERFDVCLCDGFGRTHGELSDGDRQLLGQLDAAVPTVLCTAHAWARRLDPTAVGVSDVLAKPFDSAGMLAALLRAAGPRPSAQ